MQDKRYRKLLRKDTLTYPPGFSLNRPWSKCQ